MKIIKNILLLSMLPFSASAVEYESGWDYKKFYVEVEWCKKSIIFPAAKGYQKQGLLSGSTKKEMSNEAISMLPIFEMTGSAMCYCTINEIAKDIPLSKYKRGEEIEAYMQVPRCKKSITNAMASITKDKSKNILK